MNHPSLSEASQAPPPATRTVALASIKPRPGHDTRDLDAAHVVCLAESIAALGLLEPLVVDRDGRLLAGGHRLIACRALAEDDAERRWTLLEEAGCVFPRTSKKRDALRARLDALQAPHAQDIARVPVRVVDLDARVDHERALAIEAAENTQRRDYTPHEVKQLYARLLEAGYVDPDGRPRRGERAAKPAVAAIIGRSVRTVKRLLRKARLEADKAAESDAHLSTYLLQTRRRLQSATRKLEVWPTDHPMYRRVQDVQGALGELSRQLDLLYHAHLTAAFIANDATASLQHDASSEPALPPSEEVIVASAAILDFLSAEAPADRSTIISRVPQVNEDNWPHAIGALKETGGVEKIGRKRSARYVIAPQLAQPDADPSAPQADPLEPPDTR